jgi:hypothetical protein
MYDKMGILGQVLRYHHEFQCRMLLGFISQEILSEQEGEQFNDPKRNDD